MHLTYAGKESRDLNIFLFIQIGRNSTGLGLGIMCYILQTMYNVHVRPFTLAGNLQKIVKSRYIINYLR